MLIGASASTSIIDTCLNFGTTTPTIGNSYNTGVSNPCTSAEAAIIGGGFTQSGTSGSTITVNQCYGNCGSPAITLANTNSTHTTNFNQTIMQFYQFQSNLNGFVVNASVNVAKSYTGASGQAIFLAIYTISSCPTGQLPFTPSCPGNQVGVFNGGPPQKGKFSLFVSPNQIPVQNGQWLAIGFSCLVSSCDLNDTNTNVPLFQVNGQASPPTLTQSFQTTCSCKTGAWLFIRGNVVTGAGPSQPSTAFCPGILDCLLPQWSQSWCFNPTASCVNSGGLLVATIVAVVLTFFVAKGSSEFMPSMKLPIGEVFLVMELAWIFIMTGVGVIFVWVPIFFFFLISVLFGKQTGRYL